MNPSALPALRQHRRTILRVLLSVLLTAAVGSVVFGDTNVWVVIAIAAICWFPFLTRRTGLDLAASIVVLVVLGLLLAIPLATNLLRTGLDSTLVAVFAVAGAAGVALIPSPGDARSVPEWRPWVAAMTGGIVWIVGVVVAAFDPASSTIGWVMGGDTANNLLFARADVSLGGVPLGPDRNPVPLPAAILALAMAPGRANLSSAEFLAHDITALGISWGLLIVVLCVLIGRLAARLAGPGRRQIPVAALASLVPLTWFVSGYPIEYGFFNAHVSLVIVIASLLVFLESTRSPALALALLALAAVLLLATWGPLVLFPAALALVLVIRDRRVLLATRSWSAVGLLAALGGAVAWFAAVTVPSLIGQSNAFATPGGAYPFSRWVVVALVGVSVILGLLLVRRARDESLVALISVAAGMVGWLVLLVGARTAPDPFLSYYPLKIAWLVSVVLMPIIVGLAVRWLLSTVTLPVLRSAGVALVAGGSAVAIVVVPALLSPFYVQQPPLQRIIAGTYSSGGDAWTRRVFELVDDGQPRVLWSTGDQSEPSINFWLMQMRSGALDGSPDLRRAADVIHDADSIDDLCEITELMGPGVVVLTGDPELNLRYAGSCVGGDARFEAVTPSH